MCLDRLGSRKNSGVVRLCCLNRLGSRIKTPLTELVEVKELVEVSELEGVSRVREK